MDSSSSTFAGLNWGILNGPPFQSLICYTRTIYSYLICYNRKSSRTTYGIGENEMPTLENRQVRLRLTTIPYILKALRTKKRLVPDTDGEEAFSVQFDSHTFYFKHGAVITVGENIARCLQEDAWVIVGDVLTGNVEPVLEMVGSFDLAAGESLSESMCPVCRADQNSIQGLIAHLATHIPDEGDHERSEDEDSTSNPRSSGSGRKSKSATAGAGDGTK